MFCTFIFGSMLGLLCYITPPHAQTVDTNGNLKVNCAVGCSAGGPVTISAAGNTTITLGGTSQTLFAAGSIATGAWITNPSTATESLCVNVAGGAATTTASGAIFCLIAGQTLTLPKVVNAITVTAVTTSHVFSAVSY
jgi:hypothetical protein